MKRKKRVLGWRGVLRCCRQRRHKSVEGKTFWARSYQSVSLLLACMYVYTYVYAVLSGGTRGCCGLIYRLSLPWKPRRDRLARHPHIRVDSLLYPLYLSLHHALSLSLSLSRALSLSSSHPPVYAVAISLSCLPSYGIVLNHSVPFSSRIRRFLSRSGSERWPIRSSYLP